MHTFRRILIGIFASTMAIVFAQAAPAKKAEVQWLGYATVKIASSGGKVIVIDPWLTTNPRTPDAYKSLDALGKVDAILITHGHTDHWNEDAPKIAAKSGAKIYGPYGLGNALTALGVVPPVRCRDSTRAARWL